MSDAVMDPQLLRNPQLLMDLQAMNDNDNFSPIGSYGETAPSNSVVEDMRVNINSVVEANELLRPQLHARKRSSDQMQEDASGASAQWQAAKRRREQ